MISEIFSLRHDETRRGVAGSTTINLRTHHLLSRQTIRGDRYIVPPQPTAYCRDMQPTVGVIYQVKRSIGATIDHINIGSIYLSSRIEFGDDLF